MCTKRGEQCRVTEPVCAQQNRITRRGYFLTYRNLRYQPFLLTGLAVVASLTYRSRVAIELLEEMYSCVTSSVSTEVLSANQEAISKKIQNKLEDVYTKYCDPSSVDKLTALEGKVERAKLQMDDNISKSLENTVKAEALAEKSEQALSEAAVFHKNSEKLRKHMAWKNLKMTLLLSAVIGIILLSLLLPLIPK